MLILDEPTSGMDPLVREEFLEGVLAVTAERGQTVLFSSHNLADVQAISRPPWACCTMVSYCCINPWMN